MSHVGLRRPFSGLEEQLSIAFRHALAGEVANGQIEAFARLKRQLAGLERQFLANLAEAVQEVAAGGLASGSPISSPPSGAIGTYIQWLQPHISAAVTTHLQDPTTPLVENIRQRMATDPPGSPSIDPEETVRSRIAQLEAELADLRAQTPAAPINQPPSEGSRIAAAVVEQHAHASTEAAAPIPQVAWAAQKWLQQLPLTRLVDEALLGPVRQLTKDPSVELDFVRAFGGDGEDECQQRVLETLNASNYVGRIAAEIARGISSLKKARAATSYELHDKFIHEAGAFCLDYGRWPHVTRTASPPRS